MHFCIYPRYRLRVCVSFHHLYTMVYLISSEMLIPMQSVRLTLNKMKSVNTVCIHCQFFWSMVNIDVGLHLSNAFLTSGSVTRCTLWLTKCWFAIRNIFLYEGLMIPHTWDGSFISNLDMIRYHGKTHLKGVYETVIVLYRSNMFLYFRLLSVLLFVF